jgi:ABC-type antimicrobial peptide transport system permease subunit
VQGLVGGVVGAGGAYLLFRTLAAAGKTGGLGPLLGPLGSFYMSSQTAMQGVFIALAVGAIAGIVPAWNGARLNVTEALRRLF